MAELALLKQHLVLHQFSPGPIPAVGHQANGAVVGQLNPGKMPERTALGI
jgi:hypothetical protein